MPSWSTSLSLVPKFRTAKSFTAGGVRSMTAPPTAVTGLDSGRTAAETSSATPSAVNPVISPLSAPQPARSSQAKPVTGTGLRGRNSQIFAHTGHSGLLAERIGREPERMKKRTGRRKIAPRTNPRDPPDRMHFRGALPRRPDM